MSLGYIGYFKKFDEDNTSAMYLYSGSNWNDLNNDKEAEMAYDGEILISKSVLSWEKSRQKSKHQTEFIHWTYKAIKEGHAKVNRPCKNAFYRGDMKFDYIALHCLLRIFDAIYDKSSFPDNGGFIQ